MSTFEFITFTVEERVATITLNRPQALNALTIAMMNEVRQALQVIEDTNTIRALIFTGAGKGFCSGQDLSDRIPPGDDIVAILMKEYFPVFKHLRTCRVPVIMAVNGTAAGGGFSLALTGDFLLAARSAKFIQVFSRIGIAPDLGSTYLLPRAIGRSRALQMMMTNKPLSAKDGLKVGLVSECLDDEDLMARARELAEQLASGPTHALNRTRNLVDGDEADRFENQFRSELETNMQLRDQYDAREGVAAFLEKRRAVFRGF